MRQDRFRYGSQAFQIRSQPLARDTTPFSGAAWKVPRLGAKVHLRKLNPEMLTRKGSQYSNCTRAPGYAGKMPNLRSTQNNLPSAKSLVFERFGGVACHCPCAAWYSDITVRGYEL